MDCGIYTITHTASGRQYVGSSNNVPYRWRKHKAALRSAKHHSAYLQRLWDKYGEDAFTFELVLLCRQDSLKLYEQLLLDAMLPVLNMAKSANSPVHRGQKLPQEWRDKVAETVRGRYAAGFKITHPPRSAEYRAYVSEAAQARWNDLECKQRTVEAMRAAMTPEECAKKADRVRQLWATPEYRANAIASRKGKAYNKGYKCTEAQVQNRKKAARISNMKRNYGETWKEEYVRRYPEHAGDVNGK